MKIAVVILNWNGKKLLETFLPSVLRHSKEAEIYVVDNGSTDLSVSCIREKFPDIKPILNKENAGFSGGYNQALKQIDAPLYALVNSDVEVTENWLKPVIERFKTDPNTAIVQPKILDHQNKKTFEYAGAGGGFLDVLGYPYCRGRIFNTLEEDNHQYDDSIPIQWASGACFFIKSDVFHRLNGFDEDYFAHQEEIDLCWRTANLGYSIRYEGKSCVYHVGGATLQEKNALKTFLNFRNSMYSLVKNLPTNRLIPVLLIRLLLDGVAGIRFALQGRPIHTMAILKSHLSFYKNLGKMLSKRSSKKPLKTYYHTTSIVWRHFVLNVQKFKEL